MLAVSTKNPHPIVKVVWLDSCGPHGWRKLADVLGQEVARIETVGFLVRDTDECLTIVGSIDLGDDDTETNVDHVVHIPRCSVVSMRVIEDENRMTDTTILPDGSAFFIAEVPVDIPPHDPIKWNPWNKVVQDHRDGTIHDDLTNAARAERGLPVPWTPEMADIEVHQVPIP